MRKINLKKHQPVLKLVLSLLTASCLYPLLLIIIVSFSSEKSVSEKGFSLFPSGWSLDGWRYVIEYAGQLVQSYKITLYEVFVGTALSLLLTSMFAYALSRKTWMLRGFLTKFLLVTMLFNGGMVSSYIVNSSYYHMRNNLLILILPGAVGAYNVFVMRTFMNSNVPEALVEAAKIDGASEFCLFFRIILPLMVPCLAALGFMESVGHWNEWQTAMLYMDDPDKTTLQLLLIRIENSLEYLTNNLEMLSVEEMVKLRNAPNESMRMAILCITMGPILIAYPFFQRFFIKGITVGSVKG